MLVVEDNPGTRELTASLIRRLGYRVATSANGIEAMHYLHSGAQCDLLITDIVMPGPSGLELGRQARQMRPGLPVIFMSGYSKAASAAIEVGGIPVLKPVSWAVFRRVIEEALADSLQRST